jgi:phage-related protein
MSDRFDGSAEIEVTADGATFVRQLAALIAGAENQRVSVNVDAETGDITAGINAAVRAANAEAEVEVDADPAQVRRAIETAAAAANPEVEVEVTVRRDAAGRLRDALGRFLPDAGRQGGRGAGDGFAAEFSQTATKGVRDFLSSVTSIKLPVAGFAVLAAGLGAVAVAAVQAAAALAPLVGIAGAIPGLIGGAAGAVATFQVALVGVSDAFAAAVSGDAEEFAEAIESLAPSARAAAEALREITPEFSALRQAVQDSFFTGFDQLFLDIADTLAGPLTEGLSASAAAINGIALAIGDVITSAAGTEFIESTFDGIVNALGNLEQPIADLVTGFLEVGDAINRAFGGEDALATISGAISDFAAFLSDAAASGDAVRWVENALDVFDQLGDILAPLAGIFGSISEAASQTGGNVLGLWGEALEAFDQFLASAEGMDFLVSLFETFNAVGAIFADVLGSLAPLFAPLVDIIGLVVDAVAPFITGIVQLASLIVQAVLPAVTALLTVLSPIIQLIGESFAAAIEAATAIMAPWIDFTYQLIEAFQPLASAITDQLLPAFLQVTDAIAGPFIAAAAEIIPILADALVPAITELALAFVPLVLQIADLTAQFADALAPIVADLVSNYLVPFIVSTIPAIVAGIQLVIDWVSYWVDILGVLIGWIGDVIDYWSNLIDTVRNSGFVDAIGDIIQAGADLRNDFLSYIGDIIDAFLNLGSTIAGVWDDVSGFVSNITGALNGIDIPSLPFSLNMTGTGTGTESGSTASSQTVNNNVTVNAAAADPWLVGGAVARTLTRAALGGAAWGTP